MFREMLAEDGLNQNELARRAGVTRQEISRALREGEGAAPKLPELWRKMLDASGYKLLLIRDDKAD